MIHSTKFGGSAVYEVIESSKVEWQMLMLRDYAYERYGNKRLENLEQEFKDCYQRFRNNPISISSASSPGWRPKGIAARWCRISSSSTM
jgi:hypothetical protein